MTSWTWKLSLALDRAGLPALRLWPVWRVTAGQLSDQVSAVLRAWGMPDDDVAISAKHILYADLHGIDSHGCAMMLHYHRQRAAGALKVGAKPRIVRDDPATGLIDGGGGLGHVPSEIAMRMAIDKCRHTGSAVVAVRNSGHFGAAGAYAVMAAGAGFIGMVATNTEKPALVPTFGLDAMLGTNPIAVAAPAKRNRAFLLDMATSTVPMGKLHEAWRRGKPIPLGWALDPHGRSETNPRRAAAFRRLTPLGGSRDLGGHKGYGLAAAVEVLASILPAGPREAGSEVRHIGHFFTAIDPRRFRDEGSFEEDMDRFIDGLRATRPLDKGNPVQVAGDPEYAASDERSRTGIPLRRGVVEDLRTVCTAAGVPFTLSPERATCGQQ